MRNQNIHALVIDSFHITWWPWKPVQLDGHLDWLHFDTYWSLKNCTAWCSEIGSLRSLDGPELHASSDVREPIHCTSLYMLLDPVYCAVTWFLQIERYKNGINQGGHIALVSMVTTLCETRQLQVHLQRKDICHCNNISPFDRLCCFVMRRVFTAINCSASVQVITLLVVKSSCVCAHVCCGGGGWVAWEGVGVCTLVRAHMFVRVCVCVKKKMTSSGVGSPLGLSRSWQVPAEIGQFWVVWYPASWFQFLTQNKFSRLIFGRLRSCSDSHVKRADYACAVDIWSVVGLKTEEILINTLLISTRSSQPLQPLCACDLKLATKFAQGAREKQEAQAQLSAARVCNLLFRHNMTFFMLEPLSTRGAHENENHSWRQDLSSSKKFPEAKTYYSTVIGGCWRPHALSPQTPIGSDNGFEHAYAVNEHLVESHANHTGLERKNIRAIHVLDHSIQSYIHTYIHVCFILVLKKYNLTSGYLWEAKNKNRWLRTEEKWNLLSSSHNSTVDMYNCFGRWASSAGCWQCELGLIT